MTGKNSENLRTEIIEHDTNNNDDISQVEKRKIEREEYTLAHLTDHVTCPYLELRMPIYGITSVGHVHSTL